MKNYFLTVQKFLNARKNMQSAGPKPAAVLFEIFLRRVNRKKKVPC
jgi:hypothetical protein